MRALPGTTAIALLVAAEAFTAPTAQPQAARGGIFARPRWPGRPLQLPLFRKSTKAFASTAAPAPKKDRTSIAGKLGHVLQDGTTIEWSKGRAGINLFGMYYMTMSLFFGAFWLLGLKTVQLLKRVVRREDEVFWHGVSFWVNKSWGIITLRLGLSMPKIVGAENLPAPGEPYILAANHASWMDIPFMAMMPRRFKFIAKGDLRKVPILGLAMSMSGALFVERSKASQLSLFRGSMEMLGQGDALVIYPEGTRSRTGRLGDFQGGTSKIAIRCKVPVVPVSIVNSHRVMPPTRIMPKRPAFGMCRVVIHPPISSEGKDEIALDAEVKAAIAEALPEDQKPRP